MAKTLPNRFTCVLHNTIHVPDDARFCKFHIVSVRIKLLAFYRYLQISDIVQKGKDAPYTAYQADVRVRIEDFLELSFARQIAGFALLTPDYQDKQKSKYLLDLEQDERDQVNTHMLVFQTHTCPLVSF